MTKWAMAIQQNRVVGNFTVTAVVFLAILCAVLTAATVAQGRCISRLGARIDSLEAKLAGHREACAASISSIASAIVDGEADR